MKEKEEKEEKEVKKVKKEEKEAFAQYSNGQERTGLERDRTG